MAAHDSAQNVNDLIQCSSTAMAGNFRRTVASVDTVVGVARHGYNYRVPGTAANSVGVQTAVRDAVFPPLPKA